jgi:hypothetical protein
MSQAKPIQLKTNTSGQIFAKIKNGNIYRLNHKPEQAANVIARIEQAGKINLKHWTRVEKREAQTVPTEQGQGPALRDQYLAVWEERCQAAYVARNISKLRGMVARKQKKLAALTASDCPKAQDLIFVVSREYEIAQGWLQATQLMEEAA